GEHPAQQRVVEGERGLLDPAVIVADLFFVQRIAAPLVYPAGHRQQHQQPHEKSHHGLPPQSIECRRVQPSGGVAAQCFPGGVGPQPPQPPQPPSPPEAGGASRRPSACKRSERCGLTSHSASAPRSLRTTPGNCFFSTTHALASTARAMIAYCSSRPRSISPPPAPPRPGRSPATPARPPRTGRPWRTPSASTSWSRA